MSLADQPQRNGFSIPRKVATTPRVKAFARGFALLRLVLLLSGLAGATYGADDNMIITPGASRVDAPAKTAGGSLGSMSLVLGVALAAAGGWMVWRIRHGTPMSREGRALAI